ncbi:MAG: helix-turn-helix transcriptional regulator [Candidatus Omnitrophica bacterium]|nr:helix-turn-helix transcriptional regulator [Candidatus Omnitrophota bacterium]
METVGEKIRRLIREKGYKSLKDFYDELVQTFEQSHIDRSTLTRLLKNKVVVRERTLIQIALILGVKTSFLREGTDAEVSAIKAPETVFTYNEKAAARILDRNLPFVTEQLTLRAGGRTSDLQDPPQAAESLKWIFVLIGKVRVVIKDGDVEEKKTLHRSQRLALDARQVHYFENAARSTTLCLIVHYPAANNTFYLPPQISDPVRPLVR